MLLQLFGSGIALSVLDGSDITRMHVIGIGSSAWSVIALVLSLFLGGMLAGKLSGHHERRVVSLHGLLVWAIAGIIGVISVTSSISMMSPAFLAKELPLYTGDTRIYMVDSANTTGHAMLIASLGLVLGVVAAIGGALISAVNTVHRRHDTIPGAISPGHTTAPYPVPTEPAPTSND